MTQITIYLDYNNLLDEGEAEQRITEIADYVPVYRAIARALQDGDPLSVSIERNARACAAWLRRMAEQRGEQHFTFVDVTPGSRLAEKWGVEIPAWVTDRAIRRAGLLDAPVTAHAGEGFEDVVLRVFYSPHLTADRLPTLHLADLLEDLEERPADVEEPRLLRQVYRRRLDDWRQAARSEGEHYLVELLRDDLGQLRTLLAQLKVLRGYPPQVAERAIGHRALQILPLDLNLTRLDVVDDAEMETAVDQIAVHLNQLKQQEPSQNLVNTLLGQVSGELEIEFQTLYELITEQEITVDRALVDRIEERFAPIRAQVVDLIERLRLQIPPDRPSPPNPQGDWTMSDWLQWAVDEYLPYHFWLEETERRDEEIEALARDYADWVYAHYNALVPNFPHIVYRALHNDRQMEHLTGPKPVLFIAVDNFNYKFLDHLRRLFEDAGFYTSGATPYLSMLPSCTEVSKKCLFTGSPGPFDATAYEKPILDAWSGRLKGRRLRYLPYLGSLGDTRSREDDVYFLNHTLIDDALHQSSVKLGISHAKAVRRRLSDLVDAVRSFAQRTGTERDLVVIICSDHGSTRIPAEAPNLIDQPFYTARLGNPHHRYIGLSDEEMERLPDNVAFECYQLRKGVFDLNENYLVARGYSRFKKTDETAYVHGGLTPEETIVPLCVFQPVVEAPKDLTVRLLDDTFRYGAKAAVDLELVNVNPYPCLDLRVEILDENVDCEPVELEDLPGHQDVEIGVPVRIWRRDEAVSSLRLKISYQLLGERRQQIVERPITMRSMMESGFDLEDLDGAL